MIWAAAADSWKLNIGNLSTMGRVTVAAYLASAVACALAARREPTLEGTRRARPSPFWIGLAASMFALGAVRVINLQVYLSEVGRGAVRSLGRDDDRRIVQVALMAAIGLACAAALAAMLRAGRRSARHRWPAMVGMAFLAGFVAVRAISLHGLDAVLSARTFGIKWNWIFEWSGIALVASSAARRPSPPQPPSG